MSARKVVIQRVAVVEFGVNDRSGDETGYVSSMKVVKVMLLVYFRQLAVMMCYTLLCFFLLANHNFYVSNMSPF